MIRDRALRVILVLAGLLFVGAVYPLTLFFRKEPSLAMMFSVYTTLGIFLLAAARSPQAHRSLIAFTAWSSLAHAGLMAAQVYRQVIGRVELPGVAVFAVIGAALLALAPRPSAVPAAR